MGTALPIRAFNCKKLAAPDCSILTVTAAVPDHARYATAYTIVGGASEEVSEVMGGADRRRVAFLGMDSGVVVRMTVASDGPGWSTMQALQIIGCASKPLACRWTVEVAQMLTEHDPSIEPNSDRPLELAAEGKDARTCFGYRQWLRNVAAGATQSHWPSGYGLDQRVIEWA
ncbi:MAG: hypothetical protein AAFW98_17605, partial [Pseudomonadota bacterium]